jgi:PAS domain S-box-containing protein
MNPRPEVELLYDVFVACPSGIAVLNLKGQPLFANQAFCSTLGWSEKEIRRKHFVELSHPEDGEKDRALFEQLRAGLIDHYQVERSFVRKDGSLFWGRLNLSLSKDQTIPLVIALLENITQERAIQETLELATTPMAAVTRCSSDFRYLWANQLCADLLQHPLDEIIGRPVSEVLGQEAFEALLPYYERVLKGEKVVYEDEVNYRSVGRRWISATYTPTFDARGVADGWVATVVDITQRKRAEQLAETAQSTMSQRLIQAQEEERRWIARELHDDISQRISALTMNLAHVKAKAVTPAVQNGIAKAIQDASDLSRELRALSHRLHSSNLEYLGLAAAASAYCKERSEQDKVHAHFHSQDIPGDLTREVSLCLFRVLQEALQNAIKYSGSLVFQVVLKGGSDKIELTVTDFGVGFEPDDAAASHGLGLASMKERLKLVNGKLVIYSQLGQGTTIHARVPYPGQI